MKSEGSLRADRLERSISTQPSGVEFSAESVAGLPERAQRYLLRSIRPGTPVARSVQLQTLYKMRLRENDEVPVDLPGRELLVPARGFVWRAWAKMGPFRLRVKDYYADGRGGVRVHLLGLIPVVRARGDDVSRSSRGRLVGEAIWCPSALLPAEGAEWGEIDVASARVALTIDGETIPLTLKFDEDGRLREMSMLRHGDVGVDSWQPIPYGFEVEDEATFGGHTIPTHLRGGWWYGTERYQPLKASEFRIVSACFS